MKVRIGLGNGAVNFSNADGFYRWVDLCEDGGIDSIWQADRLVSREPQLESMTVMAALAGRTKRIKFGMNAIVVSYRDPLVMAKECATIDYLSNGRLLPVFGVGARFNPEFKATGLSPKGRGRRGNEFLEIMTRLWAEDSVSYDGEFFQYKDARIAPKPVQKVLPCWIGGNSQAAIERTATLGTGWLGGLVSGPKAGEVVRRIKEQLEVTGRHIDDDHFGVTVPYRLGSRDDAPVKKFTERLMARAEIDPEAADAAAAVAAGSVDEVVETFKGYVEQGISKFVAIPMAMDEADVFRQTEELISKVLPQVENK